jgi:hypothetical protein
MDRSIVNEQHDAKRDPRFRLKSKPRPIVALHGGADLPAPDADGRRWDSCPPVFFQTDHCPGSSLQCFALDDVGSRKSGGNFPPSLERPIRSGGADIEPWRHPAPAHLEPALADPQSRRVQASPTNNPSARRRVIVQTRAVAHFVARSVALSPTLRPQQNRLALSPSTTCDNSLLQQPAKPHRKIYRPCCN